jgi:hypothetical protein
MNKSALLLGSIAFVGVVLSTLLSDNVQSVSNSNYVRLSTIQKDIIKARKSKLPEKVAEAIEWRKMVAANQHTGLISMDDVTKAREQAKKLSEQAMNKKSRAFDEMLWNETGPNNIGGRTRCL